MTKFNTASYRNQYRAVTATHGELLTRLDELCEAGLVAGSADGVLNQEFYLNPLDESADLWTLVWKPAAPKIKKSPTRKTINARLAELLPPGVVATAEKGDEQWHIVTEIGNVLATAPTLTGLNRKVLAVEQQAWDWKTSRLQWDAMRFDEQMGKTPPAMFL